MATPNAEHINEQILDLSAHLADARKDIKEIRHSISPESITTEVEERVVNKLAATFAEKQAVELEERARKESIEALAQSMDRIEAQLKRAGGGNASDDASDALKRHHDHMRGYMRAIAVPGRSIPTAVSDYMASDEYRAMMSAVERRTVNETVDGEGGYLVPADIQNTIDKLAINLSPVEELADVRTTTSNRYTYFVQTSGDTAYYTSETGTGTASQPAWAEKSIDIVPLMVKTPITEDQLADASFSMENELGLEAGKAMAQKAGQKFVAGTGVGEPWGFETRHNAAASGANYIITGNNAGSDLVAADDFYDLLYGNSESTGLQVQYRTNAIFCFNSNTLRKVLKLQDGGGNYLWNGEAGLQRGEPATIAGKPFRILEDMDDDGTNTNNPVVVADWKEYYRIVNRSGIRVVQDNLSGFPVATIYWRKRHGADVRKLEAGRLLVV